MIRQRIESYGVGKFEVNSDSVSYVAGHTRLAEYCSGSERDVLGHAPLTLAAAAT